jgi:murein L,D-transpeptidase YcbB/YkuD
MKLINIQLVLSMGILFLSSNSYALNYNFQRNSYSLTNHSIPLEKIQLSFYINPVAFSRIKASPFLNPFEDQHDRNGLIDNFHQDLIDIQSLSKPSDNGFDVTVKLQRCLLSRITSLMIKNKTGADKSLISNPELLFHFYLHRKIKPVWVTQNGLSNKADTFIKRIIEADHEGLDSAIYHRYDILTLLGDIELDSVLDAFDPAKFVKLELLLTDAFFTYGFHLSEGVVEPNPTIFDWHIKKPEHNLLKIIQTSLDNESLEDIVDKLQPHHSGYLRLKTALLKYINIKDSGGWYKVPPGQKLRKGDKGNRVAALRSRLIVSGDLRSSSNGQEEYFDDALENSVKIFQARNGLKVDGIVGSNTISALNVTVEDRIEQIKLNMERWRWLPQTLGERYILVNTANFELDIIENGQTITSTRAIVGKKKRPTPVLSQKITYLELNPYWNIPHHIALNDILPSIKKDPNYLTDKCIRIFENWEDDAKEIDPESIDWNAITKKSFAYRLRQDPANTNALGRVKFIFPNEFSIYLHDTPTRELFNKTIRTFSSGCIRIERPIKLAAYLLTNNLKWTFEKLTKAVNSKKTKAILLSDPINIHILYWTAWVDKNGVVNFRDDIYGRDRQLNIALNKKIQMPEIRYGEKTKAKMLSYRTPLQADPPVEKIGKTGSQLVSNIISR